MHVLKVVAEGITTSFRYPHFKQQIHPSFPMPPPATIYGHICSALGKWFDPTGVQFAYRFTCEGTVQDIEHIIVLSQSTGRLPGGEHKVMQGSIVPFERELLCFPRLTLYVNRPEWIEAFRSPRYAVVLGRSQDLFTYTQVAVVESYQADRAYFEHTLAPHSMALQTMRGVTMLMPRYLDYSRHRRPTFAQYLVLQERVYSDLFYRFGDPSPRSFWIDPTTAEAKGMHMGLLFHSFTGENDGLPVLA